MHCSDEVFISLSLSLSPLSLLLCLFYFCRGNEVQSLLHGSRMNEKRETFFEDRTHCHADHVKQGETTAAVGVLKAVHTSDQPK